MLKFLFPPSGGAQCDGRTRRDFLAAGALVPFGLGITNLLRATAQEPTAASRGSPTRSNGSIILVWLGGGPTHVETFDPKMDAPAEFRSLTGEVKTRMAGVTIGGTFPRLAQVVHLGAIVRSFYHGDAGHSGGTHNVITGKPNTLADNGAPQSWPSAGAMIARYHGATSDTGVPAFVAQGENIYANGAGWLGHNYNPFHGSGDGRRNLTLTVSVSRLDDRRQLLGAFDNMRADVDRTGAAAAMDGFARQGFGVLTRNVASVFDLGREDPRQRDAYGRTSIGDQCLLARRLVENGARFVTMHHTGWDMHGNLKTAMETSSPAVDRAVAALITDLDQRGMLDDTLVVVTGEFGRTPRINGTAGRDHHAALSTLFLAGGGLRQGVVVGESSAKAETPKSGPVSVADLIATMLHVAGVPDGTQFTDAGNRPQYLTTGRPIAALV